MNLQKRLILTLYLASISVMISAQDTVTHLKKHALAIIPGINATYPLFSNFYGAEIYFPHAAIAPSLFISYSYGIWFNNNAALSYEVGIGSEMFVYGIEGSSQMGGFISNDNQEMINGNIFSGLSLSVKIKKVRWYNEILLKGSYRIDYNGFPPAMTNTNLIIADNGNEGVYGLYLYMSTGVSFLLSKNYFFTPLIGIPMICLSNINRWFYSTNFNANPTYTTNLSFAQFGINLMISHNF